jgi:hypothetical protein
MPSLLCLRESLSQWGESSGVSLTRLSIRLSPSGQKKKGKPSFPLIGDRQAPGAYPWKKS